MGYYDYWSKKNKVTKPGFVWNWWKEWYRTNRMFGRKKSYSLANYYKRKRFARASLRFSKYLNNYFFYRFDCHLFLQVPEIAHTIQFMSTENNVIGGNAAAQEANICRIMRTFFYPVDTSTSSRWNQLKTLYSFMKCNGIVIKYKPYSITAPEETFGDQKPNLLFYILTNMEREKFKDPNGGSSVTSNDYYEGISSLKDSPFTRIIRFDDNLRFYRAFPARNNDLLADDAQMFYKFVAVDAVANYYPQLILGCFFTQWMPNLPQGSSLKIGDLDISIYFCFKNNIV